MMSANNEHKKMYNVYIAAFDHIFKQHMNANIEIGALITINLFLNNLESLRAKQKQRQKLKQKKKSLKK